ncbi:hypothetical protein [Thermosulfuriphilus sp.]
MRIWLKITLFLLATLMVAGPVRASSANEDLKKMILELKKELEEVKKENALLRKEVEELKAKAPAPAPAQALITAPSKKKHSFFSKGAYGSSPSAIDFYGFFKIDAIWQDASAVGDVYVLYVLPQDKNSSATINFRHSRFGFNFLKPYDNWKLFGKMEMDFYTDTHGEDKLPWNPNHSPVRARRVFLGVEKGTWQLLAGLDWLTISQLYPHLSNFPSGTFMGNPGYRMPQIRLTKWFKLGEDTLRLQVAAEKPYAFPKDTSIVFDEDPSNKTGLPGVEARVAYESKLFGRQALVALWGHYSQEEYSVQSGGDEKADSYSIGLEAKVPLPTARKAFLLGEIWYGRNFDGYYSAGVNQGARFYTSTGRYVTRLDKLNTGEQIVSVDEIDAVGGYIELELFLSPKLVTHFGWGIDNPDNDDLFGVSGARLQQQMYYANFLYRITKEFAVGAEYMYIRADYHSDDGKLNRLSGSFYYFF